MDAIILRYGFVAIFFGAAIEGEPFALAGGMLVHRHLMSPWSALGSTFAGAFLIDQIWFHLARRARENRWVQSVAERPAFARALDLLDRHPRWFILLFRFAYGVRSVAPVAIGLSRVSTRLFVPLNLVAAVAWTLLFTALGYAAGPLFERLSDRFGTGVEIGAVLLSLGALAFSLRKGSSRGKPGAPASAP